jgi:hypothetical protein
MLNPHLQTTYALQYLVLGWALGDMKLRKRLKASWFSHAEIRAAVHNLKELKKGSGVGISLELVMKEHLGVEWNASDESPLDKVLEALQRDSRFMAALGTLNAIIQDTLDTPNLPRMQPFKDEFVGRLLNLKESVDRLQWEADNPVEALKQKGRERA